MSNRWGILRDNLIAAIAATAGLEQVTVAKIAQPAGVGAMRLPAIGVCRVGGRATDPSEIGDHVNQPAQVMFQIVIRCDDASDSTSALEAAEEYATIALGVRNTDIGIYGQGNALNTGGVYLDYVKDDVMAFPGREPGGAGPIALVISLRTTELPI